MKCLKYKSVLPVLAVAFVCLVLLCSCTTENSDTDFGDDYDAEYLMHDYADQLLRDGATTVTGTISIDGEEGNYTVTVDEKKVIFNDNYEDGYYVADTNITSTYPLGSDLGIVAMKNGQPVLYTTEEFVKMQSSDKDAPDKDALYIVYLMGDVAEQILPLDPSTLKDQNN